MQLATLRTTHPDGELVLVAPDRTRFARARDLAPTLQAALDDWARVAPALADRAMALEGGGIPTEPFDPAAAASPLPRAYQWCDGSTYWAHEVRMSRWRGLEPKQAFRNEPWMYQGASDGFLDPHGTIPLGNEDWGLDLEGEIAVVTDAVPYGATPAQAAACIRLVMLCNDVSLRNLIPPELAKGFGFVQSKPASAFAPIAVTPDALGDAWRDHRLHLALRCAINGTRLGDPDAGAMLHGFDRLVAHAAKTRSLAPGSIVGGGTVASEDVSRGTACIIERRVMEELEHGVPRTPFLRAGDRVRLEVIDATGRSVFGAIEQTVVPAYGSG